MLNQNINYLVLQHDNIKQHIQNIKTSTGKTYSIRLHSYAIYKEDPKKVGITYINIISKDEYDPENGYPVGDIYKIGEYIK